MKRAAVAMAAEEAAAGDVVEEVAMVSAKAPTARSPLDARPARIGLAARLCRVDHFICPLPSPRPPPPSSLEGSSRMRFERRRRRCAR